METSVSSLGKHQILAVRADARQCGTLILRNGIIYKLLLTECMGCHVKRATIKVVLHFGIGRSDILAFHLFWQWDSLAVVELIPIGRPCGIYLQECGVGTDDTYRVFLHIIQDKVAGFVINLNLVMILSMESLSGGICRERYKFGFRMP